MKVLWITNILFPEAGQLLSNTNELKASGGWMLGLADRLTQIEGLELYVATVSREVKSLSRLEGENIVYYVRPWGKGNLQVNDGYIPYWQQIEKEVMPDIVHIHGTEYSHGHAYLNATQNIKKVVISIQGLTSAYAPYYHHGMTELDILKNMTCRDFIRGGILSGKRDFEKRGAFEVEMIHKVKHIIGRTSWDRSKVWAINPEAEYHFCNEILRKEFYSGEGWNYECCSKHTIFLSQANYPIKGLHQVLRALAIIKHHYPDTNVRIAGRDIINTSSIKDRALLLGYGKYIKRMLRTLELDDCVVFTGNLNASQMVQEYLNANVFVCPSSIENSPNSLGEAQILGVPCVASYVGGTMDMMQGFEDYLYRFEEVEMLAEKVCSIFKLEHNAPNMSEIAMSRHDPQINGSVLYDIYQKVIG